MDMDYMSSEDSDDSDDKENEPKVHQISWLSENVLKKE